MMTAKNIISALIITLMISLLSTDPLSISIFASDKEEAVESAQAPEYIGDPSCTFQEEYSSIDNPPCDAATSENINENTDSTRNDIDVSDGEEDFSDPDEDLDDNTYIDPYEDPNDPVDPNNPNVYRHRYDYGESSKTVYETTTGSMYNLTFYDIKIKREVTTDKTSTGDQGKSSVDPVTSTEINNDTSSYVRITTAEDDDDIDTGADSEDADDTDATTDPDTEDSDDTDTATDPDTEDSGDTDTATDPEDSNDTDTDTAIDTDPDPKDSVDTDTATDANPAQGDENANADSDNNQTPHSENDEAAGPNEIDTNSDQNDTPIKNNAIAFNYQETSFNSSYREDSVANNESASLSGKRILLTDDNADNRKYAYETLTKRGIEVETAENGQTAVDMVSNSAPGTYDLILMDIEMPELNGYEAAKKIRGLKDKQLAEIPIIAMMDNVTVEDIMAAERAGMQGYIEKNADIEETLQVISNVLA